MTSSLSYTRIAWWAVPSITAAVLAFLAGFADVYLVFLATSWIAFGLVALALDLVWGKGGDLSLGHTVFFGLGAYCYGIVAINLAPIVGNTVILALASGVLSGAASSAAIAYFLYYGRLGPLPLTIITYTLTLVLFTLSIGISFDLGSASIGGANGMTGIPPLSIGFGLGATILSRYGAFVVALFIATGVFIGVLWLLRQPFGVVIAGVRQNLLRTELLGYDVRLYRFLLFTISGAVAGIGGALYGAWARYVSPDVFGMSLALLIPMYVLVGGRGSLVGAFIGVLAIGGLSFWLGSGAVGGQTALILGVVLIILVLFAPFGLLGLFRKLARFRRKEYTKLTKGVGTANLEALDSLFSGETTGGAVILESRSLQKRFGGVKAIDSVSLQFKDRGIHCLIGPNGAGKSTFLKTCLGLIKPDSGELVFEGEVITHWEPYRRVRAGLGIKLQVARILEDLTTRDNLWLAAYSKLKDQSRSAVRADEVLNIIGLAERADEKGGALSHGEQQWLDIGMVLCQSPKLIFLDEPAAGMTGKERQVTVELLRRISRYAGVVVVEHDMDFVRELRSPVTVLHQGAVFAEGSIDELREDERILNIYLGRRQRA